MRESLLSKLKRIRFRDVGHLFLFLLALLPAAIMRMRRRHLWLVCEYAAEAQDNGFALFRYLRTAHPEVDAVYAIDRHSPMHAAVAAIGPTVHYGSMRHWVYYLAAEVNISSQKGGKPNAAVCYLFEVVLGWLKNRRVFLQHGVIKDDLPFLHEPQAKLSLFTCSAQPEYEFVRDTFGYPDGVVRLLGLCRFDDLMDASPDPRLVLILPTWRMWLERDCRSDAAFLASEYFRGWDAFLQSPALDRVLKETDRHAVFVVHRNVARFETRFASDSERVCVCRWDEVRIQELIKTASVLVTDFSSVYMDFAYQTKPVVYYQFDRETYRQGHLPVGYFDYERDGFGPAADDCETAVEALETILKQGMAETYRQRAERFFPMRDANNCARTYEAIREICEAR